MRLPEAGGELGAADQSLRFSHGDRNVAAAAPVVKAFRCIVGGVTRRGIFLDVDGVLAPIPPWDRYRDLDPACHPGLKHIAARGGGDLAVSSTSRDGKTLVARPALLGAT